MIKRQRAKVTTQEEHLGSSFLVRNYVSRHDLGIIQKPANYDENVKKDRHYNNGVEHAKQDLKMLGFFLRYLKPHYRLKILNSQEFNNIMQDVLAVSVTGWHDYTIEERNKALHYAIQMNEFARHVIKSQMPEEFHKILVESAKPYVKLVSAISEYGRKNNRKDIPQIESMDFIVESESSLP